MQGGTGWHEIEQDGAGWHEIVYLFLNTLSQQGEGKPVCAEEQEQGLVAKSS